MRPRNQGRFSDRVKSGIGRVISLALAAKWASVCYELHPDAKPDGYGEEIDLQTDALIIKRDGKASFAHADVCLAADAQMFVTKQ